MGCKRRPTDEQRIRDAGDLPTVKSPPSWPHLFALLLTLIGVVLRCVELGSIPGINGDEAYWGVQVAQFFAGGTVSWHTPSGNLVTPFFALPTGLLYAFFEPAFWMLRAPALLAHLALLALCYPMIRKRWGDLPALVTLVTFACSPMLIGYSRFGWDPAQSAPACFFAVCLAHDKRPWATLLAFLAALWIHPTNIFLAPVLGMLMFRNGIPPSLDPRRGKQAWGSYALLFALGTTLWVARHQLLAPAATFGRASELALALDRALDPLGWLAFGAAVIELLNGVTYFEYVVGPVSPEVAKASGLLLGVPLTVALVGGGRSLWQRRSRDGIALLTALLIATVLFYLRTGTVAVTPERERYAQWLLAPLVIALAVCVRELAARGPRWAQGATIVTLTLGALGLWSTQTQLFDAMRTHGGWSHRTFFTGTVEPKDAAFRSIVSGLPADVSSTRPATVWVEDYWPLYPIAFLDRQHRLTVRKVEAAPPSMEFIAESFVNDQVWVAWGGSDTDLQLAIYRNHAAPPPVVTEIPRFGGRNALRIYRRQRTDVAATTSVEVRVLQKKD